MSLTYSGKEASQGPCHQNNSLTLHSGFADRKARHEGDEITQPQACRGPASEATSPESDLKPSPHCFWVNQTHHHSHICLLGFMGSPVLLASQVKGSTSLASKFPGIFFFFFIFKANSATHLSATTVNESVNCTAGFCDVESCPPRLGPRLCSPFHISHQPALTWQKLKTVSAMPAWLLALGHFPPILSSHDINLALLSVVFAMTTQSLGSPCHALVGCLSEMCQWKNELCTLARKESSSS